MLVTSTPDGPATHTHSKTITTTNVISPTDVKTMSNKVNAPPPFTEGHKDTLLLMQITDPFCKCISKWLLSGKAPSYEVNTFRHIKGLLYKYVMDSNKKILSTSHPLILVFHSTLEAYDKLGHQGINRTYYLTKQQYYWKGMNKDIYK